MKLLEEKPDTINCKVLLRYPAFEAFYYSGKNGKKGSKKKNYELNNVTLKLDQIDETPDELIEKACQNIRNDLILTLQAKIKNNSPDFFEKLVVDLMLAMGYGGSRKDAGASIGKSNDEGIDGIIKEDRLGLDVIYLQAKRWEGTVGRPEIQKFVGALEGKRAKKGVFITTGKFSKNAYLFVNTIQSKVILIDGQKLAEYMIDFDLGVSVKDTYQIKRMDSDYFEEE